MRFKEELNECNHDMDGLGGRENEDNSQRYHELNEKHAMLPNQ